MRVMVLIHYRPRWVISVSGLLVIGILMILSVESSALPLQLTYTFAVDDPGKSGKEIVFVTHGVILKVTAQDHGRTKKVQWKKTGLGIKKGMKNQVNNNQTLTLTFPNPAIVVTLRAVKFQLLNFHDGASISAEEGTGVTYTLNPIGPTSGDPGNDRGVATIDVTGQALQGREFQFTVPNFPTGAGYSLAAITVDVTTMPVANAGRNQTVQVSEIVQLDGTGSTDTDGDLLTFAWKLIKVPPNSMATLSDPTALRPTLVLDEPGTYEVQLVVNDGTIDSAPDRVLISTVNSPPVANAGPDQTVFVAEDILLDGTSSDDVDNDPFTYLWSVKSGMSRSKARLSDPTSPTPTFSVHSPGQYLVELTVSDGMAGSDTDQVVISTGNTAPVANPGPDQTVIRRTLVQLDGSESNDVNNDMLTYFWSFTTLPTGSTAVLSDSTVKNPTFVADRHGLYVVQLKVYDGTVASGPETIVITSLNAPPIADAGKDQRVTVGTIVDLEGKNSSDPEGDPLSFNWTLTRKPQESRVTILNPTFSSPIFVPDLPGSYRVSLVVGDGVDSSMPDLVEVTVKSVPPTPLPGLIITNPPDGAVVSFSPISVSGLVSDPTAMVTVNGLAANLTDGVFLADHLVLQEGSNTIMVMAADVLGNTNNVSVNVTFTPSVTTRMNPIFGPETWVKQQPIDEMFTGEFLNCEPLAQYQLVITNGTASRNNRVNGGAVFLNGAEVIGPEELTAGVSQVIKPIVVQARNNLVGQLQGDTAAQVQAVIECIANCLAVTIDAPVDGAPVNEPEIVVQGSAFTSSMNPVGVVVNQQVAKVAGRTYAIGGVVVREGTGTFGTTTVVAQVTNACVHQASTAIQVTTTQAPGNQVQLRPTPDRNVAPSLVNLRVFTDLRESVTAIAWDYEGDGMIDVQGPDLFEQSVTYTQAGIYTPGVFVTDDQGTVFAAQGVVLVEDHTAFEAMLNAQWSGMMGALAQGEIDQALSGILIRKREVMRHDWTVLKNYLGELATIFDVPLHLTDGRGLRVVGQNPTPLRLGIVDFPLEVEFVLDADGQWRVRSF